MRLPIQDGDAIVRQNCDQIFRPLVDGGFSLRYSVGQSIEEYATLGCHLLVQVLDSGQVVGCAKFADDGPVGIHCDTVKVEPSHQHRGIASAMYRFAVIFYAKRIHNCWDGREEQTCDAKRLWRRLVRLGINDNIPDSAINITARAD